MISNEQIARQYDVTDRYTSLDGSPKIPVSRETLALMKAKIAKLEKENAVLRMRLVAAKAKPA